MAKHLSDEEKQMWKQYSHERARIRQAIAREKKKGSILTIEDIIPKKPTELSEGYIQHLKNMSPEFIRKKDIYKKEHQKTKEQTFEERMRQRDNEILTQMETDKAFSDGFRYKELAWQGLTEQIEELSYVSPEIKNYVSNILVSEVDTFGLDGVLANIEALPSDLVEKTERVLRYATKGEYKTTQIIKLIEIITGTMVTSEQSATITELLENTVPDDMT